MAIAFYCEEEDPKVYYDSYGYGYQLQQSQQHAATASVATTTTTTATGSQQPQQAVDENNNNNNNCALHGSPSSLPADVVNNRQLMRVVLHQVLYRCTMEGALSPAHTSCVFCNKIYYLFQLLY